MLLRSWTRGTRPWSSSLRQSTSKSFPEEHSDRPVAENVDWSFLLILLPVVAASPPRCRPCLSLPRVVVVPASCRVAPASSPPSVLTFILTSILTSVLTLSSPRRRLVASSSPSSLRRRVAVELSCHSAVVAAVFPASSPPRRLVSAPSSFHRAVIGPSRRSSVRLGAPSSSLGPKPKDRQGSGARDATIIGLLAPKFSRNRSSTIVDSLILCRYPPSLTRSLRSLRSLLRSFRSVSSLAPLTLSLRSLRSVARSAGSFAPLAPFARSLRSGPQSSSSDWLVLNFGAKRPMIVASLAPEPCRSFDFGPRLYAQHPFEIESAPW